MVIDQLNAAPPAATSSAGSRHPVGSLDEGAAYGSAVFIPRGAISPIQPPQPLELKEKETPIFKTNPNWVTDCKATWSPRIKVMLCLVCGADEKSTSEFAWFRPNAEVVQDNARGPTLSIRAGWPSTRSSRQPPIKAVPMGEESRSIVSATKP